MRLDCPTTGAARLRLRLAAKHGQDLALEDDLIHLLTLLSPGLLRITHADPLLLRHRQPVRSALRLASSDPTVDPIALHIPLAIAPPIVEA